MTGNNPQEYMVEKLYVGSVCVLCMYECVCMHVCGVCASVHCVCACVHCVCACVYECV